MDIPLGPARVEIRPIVDGYEWSVYLKGEVIDEHKGWIGILGGEYPSWEICQIAALGKLQGMCQEILKEIDKVGEDKEE